MLAVEDEDSRWLVPPYESWATPKQWVEQILTEVLEDAQPPDDARISTRVCLRGTPRKVLAAAADLIVIGNHGTGAALSRLLGSVSQKDLMHLCATKVLLGQDDQIGDELSALLGLTPMAERIVTDWATAAKGRALWLIGSHVAKVASVRTAIDIAVTETNDALTGVLPDHEPATTTATFDTTRAAESGRVGAA